MFAQDEDGGEQVCCPVWHSLKSREEKSFQFKEFQAIRCVLAPIVIIKIAASEASVLVSEKERCRCKFVAGVI